eukprot:5705291-Prorocentrum_lima.AAC.1
MCIRDSRRTYRDSIQQTGVPVGQLEPDAPVAEEAVDEPAKDETWTQQDLGRSLQLLRSRNTTQ